MNYLLQLAKDLPPGLNEDAFRSLVTLLMRLTTWLNCLPTLTPSELTFSGAGKSEIDVLDAFRKGIESFTYALWGKLVPRTDDRIAFATRFVIDHVCGGRDVEKVAEEAGRRAAIVGDEAAEREFYTYISSQREITEKLLSEPGVDSLVSSLANGADALRLGLFHLKFVFDLLTRIAHALANADGIISGEERRFIERLESACGQEIRQREQEEAEAAQPISVEDALADLNKLIGLNDTKRRVTEWARFMKLQVSRKQHGLPTTEPTLHMVFSGNPGTGKTTVARIIGKILKSLKVLEKGHVVECDRSKLVAEYLGQTAVKTNAVIDSALGGVLFIDEAYSLSQVAHFDSYGPEAIQTLLKRMEDDRGKLCVIVAGYTEPMKNFIASNPGLESRFTQFIPFLDFSPEELVAIFTSLAQENGYTCATEVDAELFHYFEFRCAEKDSSFGNARLVRNLFQSVLTAQAERLHAIEKPDRASLEELQISDVRAALAT